jgi:hypothetical protein
MKALNRLFATLFLLCIAGMATAQDVIVMKDQSTIMSKVLEITSTEIKYKKWNNQDGPTYSINRSEVVSINYENGEVEIFNETTNSRPNTYPQQTQNNPKGYMEALVSFPAAMKLNGKRLTDEELRGLIDEQGYQLYLKGKRKSNAGEVVGIIGLVPFLGATGVLLSYPRFDPQNRPSVLKASLITLGIGSALLVPGLVLSISGGSNLRNVAETFNNNQSNPFSFNISPSVMSCDAPQLQNKYGLGFTFSMNF